MGMDASSVGAGSFRMLVMRHKMSLKLGATLKPEPKKTFMTNIFYGVWPMLRAALSSCDENHKHFMSMSPSQLMVAGSTSEVTRSLKPLIPKDSQYNRMHRTAKENEVLMRSQRLLLPSFYNAGHVDVSSQDDSYSLTASADTSVGGSRGSGSAADGSSGGKSGVQHTTAVHSWSMAPCISRVGDCKVLNITVVYHEKVIAMR